MATEMIAIFIAHSILIHWSLVRSVASTDSVVSSPVSVEVPPSFKEARIVSAEAFEETTTTVADPDVGFSSPGGATTSELSPTALILREEPSYVQNPIAEVQAPVRALNDCKDSGTYPEIRCSKNLQ